jgi:hypothetical protein
VVCAIALSKLIKLTPPLSPAKNKAVMKAVDLVFQYLIMLIARLHINNYAQNLLEIPPKGSRNKKGFAWRNLS